MRSCKCTHHDLYVGGRSICWWVSVTITSVCQWRNGKCVYDGLGVCVCVSITVSFLLLTFKLNSGSLFSPHHVSQGGVQKATPHLYGSHTDGKSLRRPRTDWHCLVMRNQNPNSRRRTTVHHLERLPNMHTFLLQPDSHCTCTDWIGLHHELKYVYIQPTLHEQSSCIVIF
jgi:hypothetical protein